MSEAIRRVSTIFTIDDNEHNKKLKDINAQYKLTQSELKLAGERLKQFGDSTEDLTFKQKALDKQTKTLTDKMNLYRESIEKASKRAEENNQKLQEIRKEKEMLEAKYKAAIKNYGEETEVAYRLKEQLEEVNKQYKEQKDVVDKNIKTVNNYRSRLNETESQLTRVQGELDRTTESLERQESRWIRAGNALTNAGDKLQNFGSKASAIGSTLTQAVTVPIIAMGAMAVKSQIDFESAFAGVRKTVDATEEQFAELEQGIKDMSKQMPSSAEEISAVAESAGQLGIETENILKFTKTIMDLGNATNLVGEEGAVQLAKFANITGMSQENFDRLGSSIVALGNNSSTTEQSIVNMAMRLAGAGTQIGMSEADILGLSASLSSVGIEAELGGSSMSTLMSNIMLAVETGSEELAGFANVAGMTADEFSKAFKDDATGALITFISGLADTERLGKSSIAVLDELGIKELGLRDTLLRASGAGDLLNKTIEIGNKGWEENVALQNEANQRYQTTESQIVILKNEITDLAREIGVELLPIVKDGMVFFKDLIQRFKELPAETKENILKFAGFAAVAGPVVGIVGKLATGFGGVLKIIGKLATGLGTAKVATSAVGTAAAAAGGTAGAAGLAAGLGSVVAAVAPFAIAGTVIAGVGYGIYKTMSKDAVPSIDLFADKMETTTVSVKSNSVDMANTVVADVVKISDATKEAVGAYIEMDDAIRGEMTSLYINSTAISEDIKNDMTAKFSEMSNQIVEGYRKQKEDSIAEMQGLFGVQSKLTAVEQATIIESTTQFYEDKRAKTQEYELAINDIIEKASLENRELTMSELTEITKLQDLMRDNAITALSETEIEANVIRERMKDYGTRITAEQASAEIKAMNDAKNATVEIANQKFEETVAAVTRLRDEVGSISTEQADKMIAEAKRQRDEQIKSAEDTRDGVVNKIFSMNRDLAENVDFTTGDIITQWQRMFGTWDRWQPTAKYLRVEYTDTISRNVGNGLRVMSNALGTTHFQGGLTTINERGYELVDLPRGTKIKNHTQSENMVRDVAMKTAQAVIGSIPNNNGDVAVQVFIGNEELDKFVTNKVVKNIDRTQKNYRAGKGGLRYV